MLKTQAAGTTEYLQELDAPTPLSHLPRGSWPHTDGRMGLRPAPGRQVRGIHKNLSCWGPTARWLAEEMTYKTITW